MTPRVRAVVLNYNGGDEVVRCVEALYATEWPDGALEIVVVDNASFDGSDGELRRRFPDVDLIPSGGNLGFPANNLAMADLEGVDYLALVNNDAFVEPGWLAPLVGELEGDQGLGAACPRIVFAPRFVDVTMEAPTFAPGGGDPRDLGVRLSGLRVDGAERWDDGQRVEGFWGIEHGPAPEGAFEWTGGEARLRVPSSTDEAPGTVELRLGAERAKDVVVASGGAESTLAVSDVPGWYEVPCRGDAYDVVNNVGSVLVEGGYGADRGFLEPDDGRYDEGAEVFAWCGGGVLLRPEYLAEVGLFDERFFLYYEDTDLAWRGRAAGWRYRYVPDSRIRHIHAASSVEGSAVFAHYVERNRLLMLLRNAPLRLALGAPLRFLLITASYARRDILAPVLRMHRPNLVQVRRRTRSFLAYLRLAPSMLRSRRRLRRGQVVPDDDLLAWMVPR